jgi:carboxyl-terminal processing protease
MSPEQLAKDLWAMTDLVLDRHVDPPARQEMLRDAVKALLASANEPAPYGLSRRVSAVSTPEQFTSLLKELWPAPGAKTPPADKLAHATVEGMVASLPGSASVMPQVQSKVQEQIANNRYVGIGIQVKMDEAEKRVQILDPFRRGPARKGGVKPGDLIVKVDGKDTKGVELLKVVEWLRGEDGSPVTIVVRQPGSSEERTIPLVRGVIPFDTVFGFRRASEETWNYRIDPSSAIAYVRLNGLGISALHELRQVEARLQADGARALVLDVRSCNSMGFLQHIDLVADALLDHGVIYRIRDAHGEGKEFRADKECLFRAWPMAVLVNGEITENAMQAVVAALQDNGRAVVVGEPTKGDGLVRAVLPLPNELGALVLPTARLERPTAKRGWPVRPDHEVTLTKGQRKAVDQWLRDKERSELPAGRDDRAPDDPQLAKAVEVLRKALETKAVNDKHPAQTGS